MVARLVPWTTLSGYKVKDSEVYNAVSSFIGLLHESVKAEAKAKAENKTKAEAEAKEKLEAKEKAKVVDFAKWLRQPKEGINLFISW